MNKKVVHYSKEKGVTQHPSDGVILWPVDHPNTEYVSNASYVLTSKVVKSDIDSGVIETENTVYKPYEHEIGE